MSISGATKLNVPDVILDVWKEILLVPSVAIGPSTSHTFVPQSMPEYVPLSPVFALTPLSKVTVPAGSGVGVGLAGNSVGDGGTGVADGHVPAQGVGVKNIDPPQLDGL